MYYKSRKEFITRLYSKKQKNNQGSYYDDYDDYDEYSNYNEYSNYDDDYGIGNYEVKDINEGNITIEQLKNLGFCEIFDELRISELNGIFAVHEPARCKKDEFILW